jgi:WD40 repeat protein
MSDPLGSVRQTGQALELTTRTSAVGNPLLEIQRGGSTAVKHRARDLLVRTITFAGEKAENVCFSPNGNQMAVACACSTVYCYDCTSWTLQWKVGNSVHQLPRILGLEFSPDNQYLATGCDKVRLLSADTGVLVMTFDTGSVLIRDLCFVEHANVVAACCDDSNVYVCDIASNQITQKFSNKDKPMSIISIKNGKLVWCCSGEGVTFAEQKDGGLFSICRHLDLHMWEAAESQDGSMMVVAGVVDGTDYFPKAGT